jgi:hypothetical protein
MRLAPCHSRRELPADKLRFFCAHPQVVCPDQLVTSEVCRTCALWREPAPTTFRRFPPATPPAVNTGPCFHLGTETGLRECATCQGNVRVKVFECFHPLHHETTLAECGGCLDHDQRLVVGPASAPVSGSDRGKAHSGREALTWAVGITTAPRLQPTLTRMLNSLREAGWEEGRIFAEPGCEPVTGFGGFTWTRRDDTLGGWPNWYLALAELVQRQPHADTYLMLQDDVVFARNLRGYLESTLWPSERVGLASAYCPAAYVRRTNGWHAVENRLDLYGAVTLALPNAAARLLLGHARAINHRRRGAHEGLKHIDTMVGQWAAESHLDVFYHTPSLAQHIGDISVIWPDAANDGNRRAADFVGEELDATELLFTRGGTPR